MLEILSDDIKDCYDRASEWRRRAAMTSDPRLKADLEALEEGWFLLAESHALSQRFKQYQLEQDTKTAKRGEWQPVACAPFDRNLELSVVNGPTQDAVAFPCCRILGGWVDAASRERVEVYPTHWREWG